MSLTPLAIRKMRFRQRMRGYDPTEVEEYLELVADELTTALASAGRSDQTNAELRAKLAETEDRERQLQDTLLRAQRVSEEILANAQREAQIVVREAESTADRIVQQAIDQAQQVERRVADLRLRRRELLAKLRGTLEIFSGTLQAESERDDETLASVHALPRSQRSGES